MSDLSDKIEDIKAMMSAPPLSEVLQALYDDKNVSQDKNACISVNSSHEVEAGYRLKGSAYVIFKYT